MSGGSRTHLDEVVGVEQEVGQDVGVKHRAEDGVGS